MKKTTLYCDLCSKESTHLYDSVIEFGYTVSEPESTRIANSICYLCREDLKQVVRNYLLARKNQELSSITELFNSVKEKIDLLEYAQRYVSIEENKSDDPMADRKGQCPFCEKDEMRFSPKKQVFYCFGCHKAGDVISFAALLKKISPLEAANRLNIMAINKKK